MLAAVMIHDESVQMMRVQVGWYDLGTISIIVIDAREWWGINEEEDRTGPTELAEKKNVTERKDEGRKSKGL